MTQRQQLRQQGADSAVTECPVKDLTFGAPQAGVEAGAQDPPDDATAQRIERALRVPAVVPQKYHVVRIVPAVAWVCLPLVRHVADLEAANVLCAPDFELKF